MYSLVIIEYNSITEIRSFLSSIPPTIASEVEVIVSSNSQYGPEKQKKIVSDFHGIQWVFNARNGGFAYGMNEGLKVAKGDVLVVANPDVKFLTSLLSMIEYLQGHQEVGIIGPKIVDKNGVIQDSFRSFFTPFGLLKRQLGWVKDNGMPHVNDVKLPVEVDWVIGAFMMVRRDFYEQVGGLSEDYFMYCEDIDWCKRAHLAGYKVVYYPETVIEYKGTRSSRKHLKYTKIHIQSLITYWNKYGWTKE